MPIQVPRARANLMTSKDLTKVQNEVRKASEKTLTGAVKAWCQLFKSGKEINEILKENDIKVDKAIVPALIALARDKEAVIQLTKEILPRVNDTFCAYKEIEDRLFLFDFKVCALSYYSDIGRKGFFCAYILQNDSMCIYFAYI